MSWEKYSSSVEEYLQLDNRFDVRFEYIDGLISLRDGTPVVLLGGATANEESSEKAMVVIVDATEEEVQKLAAFVSALRGQKKEGDQR
jgi:hypothetical protein